MSILIKIKQYNDNLFKNICDEQFIYFIYLFIFCDEQFKGLDSLYSCVFVKF